MAQKFQAFAIRDAKSETYSLPFFQLNNALALRSFIDLANDPDSNVARHPEDYSLFHIGEFDDSTSALVAAVQPFHLANAVDVVQPK